MKILRFAIALGLLLIASPTDGVQKKSGVTESLHLTPTDCESNAITLDTVHQIAGEDGLIIVIARLGNAERKRELNRRRLQNIRSYLIEFGWRRSPKTVILAEGDRVEGYGRVELYAAGKLVAVLVAERNRNLSVSSCSA